MALNIENTSGAPLAINDLGIELAIGEIRDLSLSEDPFIIANSANGGDLESLISAPSISVKDPIDGTTALSVANGLAAVRAMNETHWRVGAGARIGDISDVDTSGASNGDVLALNGTTWEATTPASGDELVDADGDTRIQVEEGADDDTIRFDVGDTPAGYPAVADILTISSSGWTVDMGTANVATTAGAPIAFTAGAGNTSGAGGDIDITAGTPGVTGAGGALNLKGGPGGATSGDGGDVVISGGTASTGAGGNITLAAGNGTTTDGVVRIPNKAATNALVIDYDTDGTNAVEFRQESGSGTTIWNSNAVVGQWIFGSNAAGTTDLFIDCDNNGVMHLNDLHTGAVKLGPGGLQFTETPAGANTISLTAPTGMSADYSLVWPAGQGAADQVLTNDGSGNLAWANVNSIGGGLLGLGEWEYDATVGGTPSDKTYRFNNADPALATELRIDYNNDNGADLTVLLQALGPGGVIYAQEKEDATKGFVATIDDEGTDNTTFITFPLRDINLLGTTLTDGEKYSFIVGGYGAATWLVIATDSGNVTPTEDNDTLNLLGGTGISTAGVDATDTVTINLDASIDDLNDVDTTTTSPSLNDVLTWTGTEWEPAAAAGGTFGTEYQTAASEGTSATISTTYVTKVTLTTSSLPAGDYKIEWYAETRPDDGTANSRADTRVYLDSTTTIAEEENQIDDVIIGTDIGAWKNVSGFSIQTLGAGVHTIDIQYKVTNPGGANIRRARVMLYRVA